MNNKKNDKTINLEEIDFEIHLCISKKVTSAHAGGRGKSPDQLVVCQILGPEGEI